MHKYTRLPVYTKKISITLAIQRECFFLIFALLQENRWKVIIESYGACQNMYFLLSQVINYAMINIQIKTKVVVFTLIVERKLLEKVNEYTFLFFAVVSRSFLRHCR